MDKDQQAKYENNNPFLNRLAYNTSTGKHHKRDINFDVNAIRYANGGIRVLKRIKTYCRKHYKIDSMNNIASKFHLNGNKKQTTFFAGLAKTSPEQRKKIIAILKSGSDNNDSDDDNESASDTTTSDSASDDSANSAFGSSSNATSESGSNSNSNNNSNSSNSSNGDGFKFPSDR